jgi:uncharacterized protein YjiS (DUF1127 family)
MATFDQFRAANGGQPAGGLLNGFFGALITLYEAHKTRAALSALTDRELDDIGLSRGDIDRIS